MTRTLWAATLVAIALATAGWAAVCDALRHAPVDPQPGQEVGR